MWSGSGLQYPEAPHLYRIGDWWYLLLAEGGTAYGHSVSIARARYPRGPYEPAPAGPVLSHSGTDLPIQCTGHADLVQAVDGSWWMTLLGTRPRRLLPVLPRSRAGDVPGPGGVGGRLAAGRSRA